MTSLDGWYAGLLALFPADFLRATGFVFECAATGYSSELCLRDSPLGLAGHELTALEMPSEIQLSAEYKFSLL